MARIKVIEFEKAEDRLKEVYEDIIQKRKRLADVHMIQSLRPESIVKHMELYMEIMFSRSKLSRAEREMIAVVVSRVNECSYCQAHHGAALMSYWKDAIRVENLKADIYTANLTQQELKMCEFARILTSNPGAHEKKDYTILLKGAGLDDEAILDVVLVVAYFNFVNRIVLSLGVQLEKHNGEGFKY